MHAKYEVSISYGSKVIVEVKVDNRQTNRQTDKPKGQKQYVPDHSIRGHKKHDTSLRKTGSSWETRHISIKLDDIKKKWKNIVLIFATYFYEKNQGVFVKHYAPGGKVQKNYF